ncbi:MAG: Elongation factor Ts [Candidatus Nomurabacteria bacterium]|nr:Elongation factor Ts [Candidatus Nomurabacteria bacterium]
MDIIKELREETGLSFAQIKKALDEAGGDKEKARVVLSQYSQAQAEKKADRELAAGLIDSYIHGNGTTGVLLHLACETDFVAKNDEFKTLAHEISMHICAMAPTSINNEDNEGEETALMKQAFIKDPNMTIEQKINAFIQKSGENTKIIAFTRYSI